MEFELVWLLALPLFFGLGWLAARYEARRAPHAQPLPDAYFRGLNFLLNEQPDRAIDAFVDVVRLDPETVDLHFALGNLFRRRGETDRAIRVHQSLVDRGGLGARSREQALFELGRDYLKAGLLDRAEEAFERLEASGHAVQALQHRLEIAQMVRDWPLAIDLAARLPAGEVAREAAAAVAHFHCELAGQALASDEVDRFDRARVRLDAAARSVAAHPRVALMRGELAMLQGRPEAALAAWHSLQHDQPRYFGLVARRWIAAHASLGRLGEGLAAVEAHLDAHPAVDVLLALFDARVERDGLPGTLDWMRPQLSRLPGLLVLDRVLELRAQTERDETLRADIELIRQQIRAHAQRLSRHVCVHCGFRARQYYWQCPGCARWDSCSPQRAEELER